MNRFLRISACVTALTLVSALFGQAQQTQRSVSELVKSSVDSVVLIVVSDQDGKPVLEGSGFIVSSDGKIVTNHHVVGGAHSAIVKLNNGAFFAVDGVLADDPDHDLTVIKVSGKNLPYLSLTDSDSLSVGDHVLAIGSPLGLENSVSDGIISAFRQDSKGRSWIQTTAPASHGNSGGPLLAMDGRVAGVLTWKTSGGENLNFAVPSKLISPLLASSTVQPLGTTPKLDSAPLAQQNTKRIFLSPKSNISTAEVAEGFSKYCPNVVLTQNEDKADYVLEAAETVSASEGTSYRHWHFTVMNPHGDVLMSTHPEVHFAHKTKHHFDAVCKFISQTK